MRSPLTLPPPKNLERAPARHRDLDQIHAISTTTKIPHNRPDVVIWNKEKKTCQVIDICIPLDTNVQLRHETKRVNYVPLIDQLRRIYPGYTYRIIPIIIGALGTIPRQLSDKLKETGLSAEA